MIRKSFKTAYFRPYLDRKQGLILEVLDDATPTQDHDHDDPFATWR